MKVVPNVFHVCLILFVVGSFLHGVDPLSYFSFQTVLHDWCNKGRQTDIDSQTDSQTDRQRDRKTHTDRHIDIHIQTQTDIHRHTQTFRQTVRQTHIHRQIHRQTHTQTHRDRQTDSPNILMKANVLFVVKISI